MAEIPFSIEVFGIITGLILFLCIYGYKLYYQYLKENEDGVKTIYILHE